MRNHKNFNLNYEQPLSNLGVTPVVTYSTYACGNPLPHTIT